MSNRPSAATEHGLKLIARGYSIAAAARKAGVSWSTLWRAQVRAGTRKVKPQRWPK